MKRGARIVSSLPIGSPPACGGAAAAPRPIFHGESHGTRIAG